MLAPHGFVPPLLRVELLLSGGKDEFLTAIETVQGFVNKWHLTSLPGLLGLMIQGAYPNYTIAVRAVTGVLSVEL
jgi:hypothetical protein